MQKQTCPQSSKTDRVEYQTDEEELAKEMDFSKKQEEKEENGYFTNSTTTT